MVLVHGNIVNNQYQHSSALSAFVANKLFGQQLGISPTFHSYLSYVEAWFTDQSITLTLLINDGSIWLDISLNPEIFVKGCWFLSFVKNILVKVWAIYIDKSFLKKQPIPWKQTTIGNKIAKKITKSTRKDRIKTMCPLK